MFTFIAHSLILSGIIIALVSALGLWIAAHALRAFYRWFTRPDY